MSAFFHRPGPLARHSLRIGAVFAPLMLAPVLAWAQGTPAASNGYAPAYPPGYLAHTLPGSGAMPAPVMAAPMPAPSGLTSSSAATATDQADLKYIAKPLTSPDVPANAPPEAYLRAAQAALATGHDGQAQQAMEMAQTRLLDRSVPLDQTGKPSTNPAVTEIGTALSRLTAGDRAGAMQQLDTVLAQLGKS